MKALVRPEFVLPTGTITIEAILNILLRRRSSFRSASTILYIAWFITASLSSGGILKRGWSG